MILSSNHQKATINRSKRARFKSRCRFASAIGLSASRRFPESAPAALTFEPVTRSKMVTEKSYTLFSNSQIKAHISLFHKHLGKLTINRSKRARFKSRCRLSAPARWRGRADVFTRYSVKTGHRKKLHTVLKFADQGAYFFIS